MMEIDVYYLIDYENVGSDGLMGCNSLKKTDHIVIFFTEHAKKIDMSDIANHGSAEIEMKEVPAGKQSADIHISSYLGYLIGTNAGKKIRIVVISKDTDFDNIIKFWKTREKDKNNSGLELLRVQKIKDAISSVLAKQAESTKKSSVKVSGSQKTMLNQEIMHALRGAGFSATVGNSVAQITIGLYGNEHFLTEVHNELRKKYTNYGEVYTTIKPVLSKFANDSAANTTKNSKQDKLAANNQIMQVLSKAGFDNEIVGYVSSTVAKNAGTRESKQKIYKLLVAKYGQSKGLKIYKQIKSNIKTA